jgi:hypothetical protein
MSDQQLRALASPLSSDLSHMPNRSERLDAFTYRPSRSRTPGPIETKSYTQAGASVSNGRPAWSSLSFFMVYPQFTTVKRRSVG